MKEKKQSDISVLLGYAGRYKSLTFLGLGLSAVSMVLGMLPVTDELPCIIVEMVAYHCNIRALQNMRAGQHEQIGAVGKGIMCHRMNLRLYFVTVIIPENDGKSKSKPQFL